MRNITYENRIKEAELSQNVIFLGYIDNEKDMPYIYRDSDVVISIPNSDSSPRSVYEAMACGSNVIVSDLPWIGDKFTNGRELFIVKLHDKKALLDQIFKILNDEEKIDVQVGFKRVKDILDYHISAKALRKMYLRILRK